MKKEKTASRLLALALTVMMLVSCFVALPAMAEETTTSEKTVLWSYNFDQAGHIKNADILATSTTYPGGYLVNKDVFYCVSGKNKDGTSTSGATQVSIYNPFKGLVELGGNVLITDATTANGKRDFYDLMYGIYGKQVDGETRPTQTIPLYAKGSSYFWEFDFVQNTATINKDTAGSYTVSGGSAVNLSTSSPLYCENSASADNGGGSFFTMMCGGSGTQYALFRITNDGYVFTRDNETELTRVSTDNLFYTLNADGSKNYLPAGTTLSNVKFWHPTDLTKCYKIKLDTQYRIGIQIEVTNVRTSGHINQIDLLATVYIKPEGQENWDACIGSTVYFYRDTDYAGTGAAYTSSRAIKVADNSSYLGFGGDSSIYKYTCDGTNHLNVLETPGVSDETRVTCQCIDCGETWVERLVDGVYYKGVTVEKDCERGSYTIWVPADGIGAPFADSEYSEPPAGHQYTSGSGKCTVCGAYEFITELPEGYVASALYSTSTSTYSEVSRWDATGKYLKGQTTAPILLLRKESGDAFGKARQPFTLSFDFMLESCTFNGSLANFGELVSLVPNGTNGPGTGTSSQFLSIGMTDEETPRYYLCFNEDTLAPTLEIKMVDDGTGTLVEQTTHANYNKLQAAKTFYGEGNYTFADKTSNGVTTRTYTFPRNMDKGAYYLTLKEWVNVQCTVVPCTTASGSLYTLAMLYVNGELVATRPVSDAWNSKFDAIRFGPGAARYTKPAYYLDNVGLKLHDSLEDAILKTDASNQVFTYAFDRYQAQLATTSPLNTGFNSGSANNSLYPCVGRFDDTLDDDLTLVNNGEYAYYQDDSMSTADRITVSLSGIYEGALVNPVSKYKYEINVNMAIDKELSANFSTAKDMIRLSKYRDDYVKMVVLRLSQNGYQAFDVTTSKWYDLVNAAGTCVSPYTNVENGAPTSFSSLRVVIDEVANTYSVFVDEEATYCVIDGVMVPFINMTLPSPSGMGVTEAKEANSGFIGDTAKYHDYTRDYAQSLVAADTFTSLDKDYEYLCLFQGWTEFYLKDVAVALIPDSKVEMIGVQEKVNETSFDLRFVAGIDDVYVQKIDFEVKAYYETENRETYKGSQIVPITAVFSSINEANGSLYAYECSEGAYLAAFKVTGMELTSASARYKFIVTPTTTLADGTTVTGDSFTVVYDGLGRYLGNDKPFDVDLSQYESLGTKPVLLELSAKNGSGDYEDFFIYTQCSDPSGRYYVRYRMLYSYSEETVNGTNSTTNIESFRIVAAELVKINGVSDTGLTYTKLNNLLSSGEISLAIKEYVYDEEVGGNGVKDFSGGYHGDEHIVEVEGEKQFSLKADGVSYVPGSETKLVQCETVTFDQTTKIDRWATVAGSAGQIVEHVQSFTFTDDGMKIDRKVTWLVDDFVIDNAYPMMFTLLRVDTSNNSEICRIVSTYDENGALLDSKTLDLNYTGGDQHLLKNEAVREISFSGVDSGISAVASFALGENNDGVLASPYVAYRKDTAGADNKFYIPMKAANKTGTKTQPALGDVWEISCFYNIDYVKPNN